MIVRELLTRLAFSADESKVKSFDNAVMGLQKSLLAVVGAATAAGAAAFSLASASARYGDEVAKTARQIGFSTDALQEYRFAFDRLGVSEGETTSSLERFNRRLGEARRGSGSAASEFEALGISLRDANGEFKSAEALLPEIADAMAGAEDAAERAAIANSFFGRSGGALAMALAEGGDEIERLREEFRLLGGGLTEDQTKAAEEFTDAMTNMRTVLNGIRLQIGAELMPVFRPMIEAITQFIALNRQIILTRAQDFFQMLSDAMRNLMAVAENIIEVLSRVWSAVDNLSGFEKAALAFALMTAFMRRAWFFAGLLFLVLDDLGAWMRGEDSLLGDWFGDFDDAVEKVNSLVDALGGMENIIKAIIGLALLKWIMSVTGAVRKLAAALGFAGVAKAAGAAGAAAGAAWGASFRTAAVGAIGGTLARLLGLPAAALGVALTADAIDRAIVGEEGRDERRRRQAETGEALMGQTTPSRVLPPRSEMTRPSAPEDGSGAAREIQNFLDQLNDMSFELEAPPELETLSGDIDNSVTNTSLDFNVTQNITVPPGTTAEQLATIRAETRRALEREVNNAARALET